MKRRSFLRNTSLFTLPTILGGMSVTASAAQRMASMINEDSDRVLILIDMNGGNDGLNSFIPLDGYDNLFNARPNVIIPENKILSLTDTVGLHPEMEGIKRLYENANLKVIQNVGYPDQNRSHFRSADIWNSASDADVFESTGWMGRYLDNLYPGYPEDYPNSEHEHPFAITLGRSISGTCQGEASNFSLAIIDTDNIGGLDVGVEGDIPDNYYGHELNYLIDIFKKTNQYAEPVVEAVEKGNSLSDLYPDTTLGEQLKVVAQMISGGLKTKVYVLKIGGFDTHADQVAHYDATVGEHADLLANLSQSIYAFQQDIKALGLEKRVLGMTFSEFGRKIKSNAAFGTDHGTAAPMMVFGDCVAPGFTGDNPHIADDVDIDEGVAMQYDFRSIYGSVLMDWFEVPEEQVKSLLTPDFQYIPILGVCTTVISDTDNFKQRVNLSASPNPFSNNFQLEIEMEASERVKIDISDVQGRLVKDIGYRTLAAGIHRLNLDAGQVGDGIYFVRIQIGNQSKSLRLVKF